MTGPIDPDLRAALAQIARVPQLLVACDYDGTLAPIVVDPTTAVPLPEAVAAVRSLAALPQTSVAVVSGRALRDLAILSRLPAEVHLIGSHGSEFDLGFVYDLRPELVDLLNRVLEDLRALTARPGVRLEIKPASVAVHTRGAAPDVAAEVVRAVCSGPAMMPGVYVTEGDQVVELAVVHTDKGLAINSLRQVLAASAVLFLGDAVTDENAFRELRGPDVGVKVGPGETRAAFRVADPTEAAQLLAWVRDARERWLFGGQAVPIERHSMLSNGRTVALLTPDARVTWFCHPRPDSSAIFADLLGGRPAGHLSVLPERAGLPFGQRYRPGTMTVETRWPGVVVTDWLDHDDVAGPERTGALVTTLTRVVTGTARVRLEFAPRPEFGQVAVRLQALDGGIRVHGSNEPIVLCSPGVEWEVYSDGGNDSARAVVDLSQQSPCTLDLRCGTHTLAANPVDAQRRREIAEQPWRQWAATLKLPSDPKFTALALRSALTLRGLWHQPTGAILAAATTSLPEHVGGVRNWDYRYCWLRDAAMSARALVDLGSLAEAESLLTWIDGCITRTGGHPDRLHPLYTVDGLHLGAEAIIDTLPGYAGSRPVRIGNAANRQLQLDVFGPIVDLVAAVAKIRGAVHEHEWRVVESMVAAVEQRWHEPDHGVWEARLAPRHHVYSKVMCWLTVDRALALAQTGGSAPRAEWIALRERIKENVLRYGWNEKAQAFTQAYDTMELDAASLWIGLAGLVPSDDERFLATVTAIESELRRGSTVYRYRWDDGLPGTDEGGFHICTAWLIEAYLLAGRRADAEGLFDQLLDCVGPTGLLPELYDPVRERGLGNHPQAYSHLGLIRCAQLLD